MLLPFFAFFFSISCSPSEVGMDPSYSPCFFLYPHPLFLCLPLDSLASLSSAPVSLVTPPSLPPCFLSLTGFHFFPVPSFPYFTTLVSFPFFLSPLSYLPLFFPGLLPPLPMVSLTSAEFL